MTTTKLVLEECYWLYKADKSACFDTRVSIDGTCNVTIQGDDGIEAEKYCNLTECQRQYDLAISRGWKAEEAA